MFERADLVFVGVAAEADSVDLWLAPRVPFSVTTFEVDEVLKDEWAWRPGGAAWISVSNGDPLACGASFTPGTRYLVHARRPDPLSTEYQLAQTGYCGYEAVADTSAALARVRAVAAGWERPDLRRGDGERVASAEEATGSRLLRWSVVLNVVLGLAVLAALLRLRARAS